MDKLKPCPFCGGKAEIIGGPEDWAPTATDPDSGGDPIVVFCKSCECGMHFFDDYGDAIAAWNRRPPARIYTLEELREMDDGEYIWLVDKCVDMPFSGWEVIYMHTIRYFYWSKDYKHSFGMAKKDLANNYDVKSYGKTWLAYDRPPGEE